MAVTDHLHDWRQPCDEDWQRLRALLRAAMIRCRLLADAWDEAQRDVRTIAGENSSIGLGRLCRTCPHGTRTRRHAGVVKI